MTHCPVQYWTLSLLPLSCQKESIGETVAVLRMPRILSGEGRGGCSVALHLLVTTKVCRFKRFASSFAPRGKLAGANLFDLCSLLRIKKKKHQWFKVQVNKSSKTAFQILGNSIMLWGNEAVLRTTETHDPKPSKTGRLNRWRLALITSW